MEKVRNWFKTGNTKEEINKTCHIPAADLVDCMQTTTCWQEGKNVKTCASDDKKAQKH